MSQTHDTDHREELEKSLNPVECSGPGPGEPLWAGDAFILPALRFRLMPAPSAR